MRSTSNPATEAERAPVRISGLPHLGRRDHGDLGDNPTGLGGRCQELALAAARVLDGAPVGTALLAAGTDGRDGPTDAAGAIVDGKTWAAIASSGRDPVRDLAAHDAYPALDAVGALLKPGLTGTNVMDVVIGICREKSVSGERKA